VIAEGGRGGGRGGREGRFHSVRNGKIEKLLETSMQRREGGREGTYRGMGSPFISKASNTSPRRSTALLLGIEGGREGGREERNIPWDRLAIHLEG